MQFFLSLLRSALIIAGSVFGYFSFLFILLRISAIQDELDHEHYDLSHIGDSKEYQTKSNEFRIRSERRSIRDIVLAIASLCGIIVLNYCLSGLISAILTGVLAFFFVVIPLFAV